jgi:hypothetical protein
MSLLKEDETGNELFEKRTDPHGGFSEELGHVLCLGLVKGVRAGAGLSRWLGWTRDAWAGDLGCGK